MVSSCCKSNLHLLLAAFGGGAARSLQAAEFHAFIDSLGQAQGLRTCEFLADQAESRQRSWARRARPVSLRPRDKLRPYRSTPRKWQDRSPSCRVSP